MARVEKLQQLLQPEVEALGYVLWGIVYLPQGKHGLLRVYIDHADGIGIEDCEKVSRQISSVLDVEDPISGEYALEVSSPGLDRSLFTVAQYQQFVGSTIAVRLGVAQNGRRKFQGVLLAADESTIRLQVEALEVSIPFDHIEQGQIVEGVKP